MEQSTAGGPKEFFLNLLSLVSLYAAAISLTTILFQIINLYFPDALSPETGFDYATTTAKSTLRYSLSVFMVFFPTFLIVQKFLPFKTEENKLQKFNRWMVYLTLFICAVINLITLITVINYGLSGELTLRFALKVLSVFFVALSTVWYCLNRIKQGK